MLNERYPFFASFLTAFMNGSSLSTSSAPELRSPLHTSTPNGRTPRMAETTLDAFNPPAR